MFKEEVNGFQKEGLTSIGGFTSSFNSSSSANQSEATTSSDIDYPSAYNWKTCIGLIAVGCGYAGFVAVLVFLFDKLFG